MDKLHSTFEHKVSILSEQFDRFGVNLAVLEDALQRAKSSIQSPSDVQFLLSRPDIVSTLETEKCYSIVLEPEAQFFAGVHRERRGENGENSNFDFSYP